MGRFLAIDFGTKRCGIAVSDPLKIIAVGLDTISSHELMKYLEAYFKKEEVDCVIFGKPMQTDNTQSKSFIHVERFVKAFRKRFPEIEIQWEDERMTSKMAVQAMIEGGFSKSDRRRKGNIDKMSATLILKSYMDQKNNLS